MTDINQEIINNLKEVYDPEISINVYDLGLIYEINVSQPHVDVVMTLTSAFCPAADMIISDVTQAVLAVSEVETCDVEVTFEPPFTFEMMSDEAKILTGYF